MLVNPFVRKKLAGPLPLILACATILSVTGSSQQDSAGILRAVDAHYNHLNALQAHFVEHFTGMGMDRTESGTLLLKKPGRMRWSYDTQNGKLFILDGKQGWFYAPGDAQAQHLAAKQLDDARSPLRFLLGHTQLERELEHVIVKPAGTGYEITGTPKYGQHGVASLSLAVDGRSLITALTIQASDGTTTTFTFSAIQENPKVPDAEFHFTPPRGVTVVEGSPPI